MLTSLINKSTPLSEWPLFKLICGELRTKIVCDKVQTSNFKRWICKVVSIVTVITQESRTQSFTSS